MANRTRDYRKEYQGRIALAKARAKLLGRPISRSQARGHARTSEVPIAVLKRNRLITPEREATLKRYYRAIRRFLKGESVTAAAKKAGMSPATLKRIGKSRGVLSSSVGASKPGPRKYELTSRTFTVITPTGRQYDDVAFDRANASVMGQYWNAVSQALSQGQEAPLKPFKKKVVIDMSGREYRLMTHAKALQTIMGQMSQDQEEVFSAKLYRKLSHGA